MECKLRLIAKACHRRIQTQVADVRADRVVSLHAVETNGGHTCNGYRTNLFAFQTNKTIISLHMHFVQYKAIF